VPFAYARPRRRSRRVFPLVLIPLLAGGTWWIYRARTQAPGGQPTVVADSSAREALPQPAASRPAEPTPSPESRLVAHEQVLIAGDDSSRASREAEAHGPEAPNPQAQPPRDDETRRPDPVATRAAGEVRTGRAETEQARQLLEQGKLVEARQALNALLRDEPPEADATEARALLTRVADETIFNKRLTAGDPLVDTHVVQEGDRLVNIARNYDVPYEILLHINGMASASSLRAGQKLKVVRGPFHARIFKSKFRLDVYLQDTYVRSFRVGLGLNNGTPEGGWRVKNRLENPTYYPPASAPDKRIIPPDDPANPLGEHWIGLEGVEGAAVGHDGYGIHGTIEPESIGKAVSMGCIRMHNEDVALLYKLLQPGKSTVTVQP